MLKKSVLLLILIFLISLVAVSALSFEVTTKKIKDTITVDSLAEFELTVHNTLATSQKYKIRTLDYPIWDVYTKPLQNPITRNIGANQSSSIKLYIEYSRSVTFAL